MSEHRRKPPRSRSRRAAPSSRRAAPRHGGNEAAPGPETTTPLSSVTPERPYGSRAEARRAMRRGGHGRRRAGSGAEGVVAGAAVGGRRRRAAPPQRKRFIDYPRSDYRGLRRWVPSWRQVLGTAITFVGVIIGLVGIAYAMLDIPKANELALSQSNVYYWADGSQMVTTGGDGTNRVNVELADIPTACQDAAVSAENSTFWEDSGIDPLGIARAVVNMARGGEVQSGSTITQQYVKNMYLTQDQTLTRKFKELLLSVKVGTTMEKEEILEGYFNTSYFGRGAYGIQAAAQAYYAKDANELNGSECAFLTALLKGSAVYDPYASGNGEEPDQELLQNAKERWSWILDRRVEVGTLSASKRATYTEFPMPRKPTAAMNMEGQVGYMVSMVDSYLENNGILTEEQLAAGGYHIHTTFQKDKMDAMENAVEKIKDQYLDPENREEDRHVQFGGASVVPGDGAIVAIYGGENYLEHYTNNADNPGAQVGSTFKPFVLAAAMRDGIRDPDGDSEQSRSERTQVSLDSVYRSEDGLLIRNYDGSVWHGEDEETGEQTTLRQNNFEGGSYGDITLLEATEVSANSSFVQLGMDVGPATVKDAAEDAGLLESTLGPADDTVPSFSLGVSTPGPMRMASAYSTFAAGGEQNDPYSVTKVENSSRTIYEHEQESEQPFSSAVASNVNKALVGVVEDGSGAAAQELGKTAAGKTGTTDDNKSAWFVGYTSNLSTAIGMWRKADSKEDLSEDETMGFMSMYGTAGKEKINGGSLPTEIWTEYMKEATAGDPDEDFGKAQDIGETVYGGGASSPEPEPTTPEETTQPTETVVPDDTETATPDPTPTETTEEPTPTATDTCSEWDTTCSTGGTDTGGTDTEGSDTGADTGGTDTGGTDTSGSDTSGNSEGNSSSSGGSIFGRGRDPG